MKTLSLHNYTVIVYEHNTYDEYRIIENNSKNFIEFWFVNSETMYFANNEKAGTYTVSHDNQYEYTYRILKTKVKAINAADGLYKHFVKCIEKDFAVESWVVEPIKQILKQVKPKYELQLKGGM